MEIKNDVTIGDVTMKLTFDFETQKCKNVLLVMPQTMDGQDLALWRKRYANEIFIAKQTPTIQYFYALSSGSENVDGMEYIRYLNIGLNTRSRDDLRDELIAALLKTDRKWSKEAIKKLKRKTLDELCTEYKYSVIESVTPIINNEAWID